MFQTSVDLLYVVIAFCMLIFTGFLVWILYYVAQISRQGNEVVQDLRHKVAEFEEALANIKEKVVSSTTSISFVAKEIGTIVDLIKSRKDKFARRVKK